KPTPDGRLRGACPHLICSSAPPLLLVLSRHTLVQMPTPLRIEAHVRYPLLSDLCGEHRAKPVPPKPDRLMADVDPPFGQEILVRSASPDARRRRRATPRKSTSLSLWPRGHTSTTPLSIVWLRSLRATIGGSRWGRDRARGAPMRRCVSSMSPTSASSNRRRASTNPACMTRKYRSPTPTSMPASSRATSICSPLL